MPTAIPSFHHRHVARTNCHALIPSQTQGKGSQCDSHNLKIIMMNQIYSTMYGTELLIKLTVDLQYINPTNCTANENPRESDVTNQQTANRSRPLKAVQNQKERHTLQWHDSLQVACYVLSNQLMNSTCCMYQWSSKMPAKLCVALNGVSLPKTPWGTFVFEDKTMFACSPVTGWNWPSVLYF